MMSHSKCDAYLDILEVKKIVLAEMKKRGMVPENADAIKDMRINMGCGPCAECDLPAEGTVPSGCRDQLMGPHAIGMTINYDSKKEVV